MGDLIKNVTISLLVLLAISIAIFIILFLHPTLGNEGKKLRVRFADLDKVTIGTRVTFAGKPVGEVLSIEELPDAIHERKSRNGIVYVYELILRVDSSVNVFNTDKIVTMTSGLLGDRSINIVPRPPKEGEAFRLVNDQIIYAYNTETFESAITDLTDVALTFQKTLNGIYELAVDVQKSQLIKKTAETVDSLSSIAKALDEPDLWSSTLENLSTLFDRIVKSWTKVDTSLANLIKITSNGDKIVTNIYKGEGTFGQILMKEDLYLKVNAMLNKADILFNDINHYGILFHTDKGWQRLRARRLNLMQRLRSPQEFRNYFNDEVDQISSSLARVSMVLAMTEQDVYCCELINNCEFAKVFKELLRRVNTLDEEIKSFNIQVFEDCSVPKTELVEHKK